MRVLMVFLTKSMASAWVLLDFQLPAIMRLFRAKEYSRLVVLNMYGKI